MNRNTLCAALAAFCAVAIGNAYAANDDNDALAIESARIGLAEAVNAAVQHAGGKASRAEYEKSKGQWVFDVEVVNGKKVMDVKIDASTGKVLRATEDKVDHDDDNDADD